MPQPQLQPPPQQQGFNLAWYAFVVCWAVLSLWGAAAAGLAYVSGWFDEVTAMVELVVGSLWAGCVVLWCEYGWF